MIPARILLLLFGIVILHPQPSAYAVDVEIIAHRGASYLAPENTMASVRLAWELKADAVEIDVMLSRDGQIFLFHDKELKRLAGVAGIPSELTFTELRRLDVGKWKSAKFAGERIPLLSEALASIPEGKRMFVELKTGSEIVPELKRVVTAAGKQPAQIVFISFDYAACVRAKKEMPKHVVAYISRYKRSTDTPALESLIKRSTAGNLDALDLDGNGGVSAKEAKQMKAAGLGYYVWTINDPKRATQLIKDGVDGITTDRPDWLRRQLDRP